MHYVQLEARGNGKQSLLAQPLLEAFVTRSQGEIRQLGFKFLRA